MAGCTAAAEKAGGALPDAVDHEGLAAGLLRQSRLPLEKSWPALDLKRLPAKVVQQARALLDAIESLPDVQRQAFLLQAEAGMDVQEIARTTGTSFETAKSRLRYATARLKEALGDG